MALRGGLTAGPVSGSGNAGGHGLHEAVVRPRVSGETGDRGVVELLELGPQVVPFPSRLVGGDRIGDVEFLYDLTGSAKQKHPKNSHLMAIFRIQGYMVHKTSIEVFSIKKY